MVTKAGREFGVGNEMEAPCREATNDGFAKRIDDIGVIEALDFSKMGDVAFM